MCLSVNICILSTKYYYEVYIHVFSYLLVNLFSSNFIQGEDAGNYMCVATNDAGVVERSVTLTLQSKYLSSVFSPVWHQILHLLHEQNMKVNIT